MIGSHKFKLADGVDAQQMVGQLVDDCRLKKETDATESLTFYDTFDWRLYNRSLVLYQLGEQLYVRKLFDLDNIHQTAINGQPLFVWDLPESELKTHLGPVIEMRALLRLAETWLVSTTYRVLDPAEKTVLWLTCEELRPAPASDGPALATYVRLKPVRGYSKYAKQAISRLQESGLVETGDIYFNALEPAGKTPGDYTTKLDYTLSPDMPAGEAARVILCFLLSVIKSNEPYVKQDIDTEFLHDFRVAVRRTRAALSQLSSVFPEETGSRFGTDFAFIGQLSNQLRDLDVYLLSEDSYQSLLPEILRADIEPLFDLLRSKRSKALQDTIDGLNSARYRHTLQNWEAFLNEPSDSSSMTPDAARPVIELARAKIYKRYKRVIKSGKRILKNSEDEMLHALRIEGKKLRYLIEFFSSLFPADEIELLTKQLKKLQNNLGDFNDLAVQEAYLLNIASELPEADSQSRRTLLAMGSLIGTMDTQKQQTKADFAQTFIDFASPANRKLFRQLFAVPKERTGSS